MAAVTGFSQNLWDNSFKMANPKVWLRSLDPVFTCRDFLVLDKGEGASCLSFWPGFMLTLGDLNLFT
jgi:hypothetical protein